MCIRKHSAVLTKANRLLLCKKIILTFCEEDDMNKS